MTYISLSSDFFLVSQIISNTMAWYFGYFFSMIRKHHILDTCLDTVTGLILFAGHCVLFHGILILPCISDLILKKDVIKVTKETTGSTECLWTTILDTNSFF